MARKENGSQKTRLSYAVTIRWLDRVVGQTPKVSPAEMWIESNLRKQEEARYKRDLEADQAARAAGQRPNPPTPLPLVVKTKERMEDEISVVFPRDAVGRPVIREIQVKGALKAAADAIAEPIGLKGKWLINEFVRIEPHEFPLPDGAPLSTEVMTVEVIEAGKAPDSVIRIAEVVDVAGWEMACTLHAIGGRVTANQLEAIVREAGMLGIGGSRKQGGYGKFELVSFEEV